MARFQVLLLPHLLLILFLLPEPGLCFPLPAVPPLLSRVPFDCRRIHPAFCCSSRVRQNCGQLCLPSSAPSFCIGQQGPQPQQPSATSFGGSIDSVNVNVPSEFNGPLPILPPPILPPPIFPSQQNNGQRRFTTEGERQSSTAWVRPEQAQRPPQLPPQPPPGLILPPTDIESAKGTPWVDPTGEDEDSDMAPPPNQQTGTFIGSGPQTEVDAATEGPAPFPTLMPSDLLPSIDELAVEQTAGNSKSHSETGEEPGPAPEEPSLISRTDGGAIDGTAGKQNAKRRGGGGHRRGSVLKPAHLMGELEELEEEREEGMEVRQVASAERTLNREASSSEDAKWWAPIRLSLLNGQQEERESNFKPDQPRTTVTEKNGGAVSTEMPPRKFAAFPPPPNGQFWSFRVKPSASDPQRQHQSEQEGSNQRDSNNKNSEESSRLDLPLPPNAGVGEKRKEEEGGLFGEKIDVFVDRIFNRELLGSIAAITNGARGNKKNGTSSLPTHTSSNTFAPSTSPNPPAPATAVEQCGVAPLFQPCLPLAQANLRLQACCRSRLLPAGCLSLCRYETSQAEVKMAFDKGQCGILNVTPFLECASQGNNNLECCRHRELAKRSGTQCEVFCAGEKLGLLGIQHLVCSTQIQSILECHHSGLH